MTLRDAMLRTVEACRTLMGVAVLDQRPTRVTIRQRRWSGSRIGVGTATDTDLILPQHYDVKEIGATTSEKLAGSGGAYNPGEYARLVVTPHLAGGGGGYTKADLDPKNATTARGFEVIYILAGGMDGEFVLRGIKTDRPYRYELVLQRRSPTAYAPPVTPGIPSNAWMDPETGTAWTDPDSGGAYWVDPES